MTYLSSAVSAARGRRESPRPLRRDRSALDSHRILYNIAQAPVQMKPKPSPTKNVPQSCEPEELVGFWINLASRTILRVLDERMRPFGFAMSQLPVLRALAQGGALPQKDLVRIGRVEQQTMAQLLARMERDGLVQREPDPADRRASLTSLTKRARARFPKAAEALLQGERDALAGFSDEERSLFVDFLKRVVRNLDG